MIALTTLDNIAAVTANGHELNTDQRHMLIETIGKLSHSVLEGRSDMQRHHACVEAMEPVFTTIDRIKGDVRRSTSAYLCTTIKNELIRAAANGNGNVYTTSNDLLDRHPSHRTGAMDDLYEACSTTAERDFVDLVCLWNLDADIAAAQVGMSRDDMMTFAERITPVGYARPRGRKRKR